MKKMLVIVGAVLWFASGSGASPSPLTCNTGPQVIQGGGFTLGFSCTSTSQGIIVPDDSHGNTSSLSDFHSGTFTTWDYSLTLLSSGIPGLVLTGTYYASGHDDNTALSTWTLSGVGNVVDFSASGYLTHENPFTISGNGSAITVFAPGPVPESPSAALMLLGMAVMGGLAKWQRSPRRQMQAASE